MNSLSHIQAALSFTKVKFFAAVFFLSISFSLPVSAQDSTNDEEIFLEDLSEEDQKFLEELLKEPEKNWTFTGALRYRTRQIQNGVDISTQPLIDASANIFHSNGFSAGASAARRIGDDPGFQSATLSLGYTYSLTDWLDIGGEYSRFMYPSSDINPLAGSQNLVTLNADFLISRLILSTSYDIYFGEDASNYLTFSGLLPFRIGELRISPLASLSITSYEISNTRLVRKKGKILPREETTTTTEAGISSVMLSMGLAYPLGYGFSATFTPVFAYTPQENLASQRSQFFFSAGIRYSVEF